MVKKGKGGGKAKKTLKTQKLNAIENYLDHVRSQFREYETRITSLGNLACDSIRKMYSDKLKSLPEHIKNMTLAKYLTEDADPIQEETKEEQQIYRSEYIKTKLQSEKKKKREERKRSMSVCTSSSAASSVKRPQLNFSRVMSESSLFTPLSKRSVAPAFTVTPKFNPKGPVNQKFFRKPKPGEVVMSISGSPLQNPEDVPRKLGIELPLKNGKVVKITEDTDVRQLERDLSKEILEETTRTLENLTNKLSTFKNQLK